VAEVPVMIRKYHKEDSFAALGHGSPSMARSFPSGIKCI
jgi:hypothetical protein